jgi:hypothetical protein
VTTLNPVRWSKPLTLSSSARMQYARTPNGENVTGLRKGGRGGRYLLIETRSRVYRLRRKKMRLWRKM